MNSVTTVKLLCVQTLGRAKAQETILLLNC